MKALYSAAAALLLAAAPAQAVDVVAAMDHFCVTIRRDLNGNGLSGAPGTPIGALVAQKANQSSAQYAFLWQMAKGSGNSNCQRMY